MWREFFHEQRYGGVVEAVYVFLGGGAGAVLRYWLGGAVHRVAGADFPYGTLLVNALGSLLIGLLMALFEQRFVVQPAVRLLLTIGFLGGFTTFSTFSYETLALLRDGVYVAAALNIALTLLLCLAAVWLGHTLGTLL